MPETIIRVKIIPNSKINSIVEQKDNYYKIKITAPAIEGKANKALITFLSQILKKPKSSLKIIRGEKAREKTIQIN